MVAARLPAGRFLCTPAGAVAVSRRRLRRLLLGLAVPMATLAVWLLFGRRYGAAAMSLGAGFLAWFAWRMSGDLDPFWLETGDGELAVQMRRRREAVALRRLAVRVLEIDLAKADRNANRDINQAAMSGLGQKPPYTSGVR